MDRRDALKSFLAIPAAATIERHVVGPGDIAVIRCDGHLGMETIGRIAEEWNQKFPDIPCVVLDSGMSLEVLKKQ